MQDIKRLGSGRFSTVSRKGLNQVRDQGVYQEAYHRKSLRINKTSECPIEPCRPSARGIIYIALPAPVECSHLHENRTTIEAVVWATLWVCTRGHVMRIHPHFHRDECRFSAQPIWVGGLGCSPRFYLGPPLVSGRGLTTGDPKREWCWRAKFLTRACTV